MYSLAIVDDNAAQVELVARAVESFSDRSVEGGLLREGLNVRTFSNPRELALFTRRHSVDICLMDICFQSGDADDACFGSSPCDGEASGADAALPSMCGNGIDAVKELFLEGCGTQVIYLSAYTEYCSRVYETEHTWFLTKPLVPGDLDSALTKAIENLRKYRAKPLVIQVGGTQMAIAPSRIRYIESSKRKVTIYTNKGEFEIYAKLSDLLSQLPDSFLQCHKSFIVNMAHIEEISAGFARLHNGDVVPVSRARRAQLREAFVAYVRSKM